jgi:uncharacterized Zn finger protein
MSKNWWGAAWTEKMERLAESSRFKEGAVAAAGNAVQRVRLEGGTIVALVQLYAQPAYTVRITFDAFSREQWEQLLANVRDWHALASSLAAADLPLELQTAFSKAKLRFMPERYADLHLECGCPDWLKPCAHLVAVWLRFGRGFESDPMLLFQLRGMERQALMDFLRGGAAHAPGPEPEFEEDEDIEAEAIPVNLQPLPADPEAYWAERAFPVPLPDAGERRLLDDGLLEKLGPAPFVPNWSALEPQFHSVYDSVYQLAVLLLKQ